jgi:hypothetical protein
MDNPCGIPEPDWKAELDDSFVVFFFWRTIFFFSGFVGVSSA